MTRRIQLLVLLCALDTGLVHGQGCVIARSTSPVLGSQLSPYLEEGEWQLGLNYRFFNAAKQYTGTNLNTGLHSRNNNIVGKFRILDVATTYAFDKQWNLTVNVPYVENSSSRALPTTVLNAPRFVQEVEGVGDVSLMLRRWMTDWDEYDDENLSLGLGVKLPTGNDASTSVGPDSTGANLQARFDDPAIQAGDGGTGIVFDLQYFKQLDANNGNTTLFVNAFYLANPRGQNETLSPPAWLSPTGPGAIADHLRFNTVSDQYLVRLGFSRPLTSVEGLSFLLAGRWEGVPQDDLLGDTVGFRRPGYVISLEPGFIYTHGRLTFSATVPIKLMANRQNYLGVPGDSTFADQIQLVTATYRFGTDEDEDDD